MKKTILAGCIALATCGVNASGIEPLSVTGFASVTLGKADNAVGYAGYTDDGATLKNETLAGLQFDLRLNDRAKLVAQVVSNSHYEFEPKIEMAYASYDFDAFTARAGKLRLPLFFYSDYIDLGYAYPMVRPSQEVYSNIVLKSYVGAELLIPIEFENSSLLLQPVIGTSTIAEEDAETIGEVKLKNLLGLSANWNYDDWTVRGSYFIAQAHPTCDVAATCAVANFLQVDGQDGTFISMGVQYDDGSLLANLEATDVQLTGRFADTHSVSGLLGYRIGQFTPYVAASWMETTDDDERAGIPQLSTQNFERISYSLGSRWDFKQNMAFKFDVTYSDFKNTSGGTATNVPNTATYEDDALAVSARIDFIF